jgi:DNA-binding transcriptional LysR family regulator
MDRDLLSHLPIVLRVAKLQGFAAAAASLNMSPSAVSHAVRAVEDRLGEPLFLRTTRSVSLTEAGARLVAAIGPAFDDIGQAIEGMAAERGTVTGTLRINTSRVAALMALTPILARLARVHPQLTVEVQTNDALVDIVAEGFDAGIRLGDAVQQDMVTVRLTPPFKAILVAAPAYLREHGTPQSLAELATHNCIGFRLLASGSIYEWDLKDGKRAAKVRTHGTSLITDATYARDLALAAVGIAYIFEPLVRTDIAEGKLRCIMPQSAVEEQGFFLYFPRRASLSPKMRAFIDVAKAAVTA